METKKIRVLIVDDEERFRDTTRKILEKRGFSVNAVGSGIEAIGEVEKNNIDVVVLDIKMPGMDGTEALKKIKSLKPELEVIMLTGHGTPESAMSSLLEGVFDYLTKPCDIDVLAGKIRDAFYKNKGISEQEPLVGDIMVPLSSFSTIREDKTVTEAIGVVLSSFKSAMSTSKVHEAVHRSTLILDKNDNVIGVMTFSDLLTGVQPPYMRLLKERPMLADNVHVEPPSYSGIFTVMVRDFERKKVSDLMSEAPPIIEADANLMEAANLLLTLKVRRLLVMKNDSPVGVIREQDLFFEMARILEIKN